MINIAGLFSEPSLIIFTKGANNSDHDCICIIWYVAWKQSPEKASLLQDCFYTGVKFN